MLAYCCDTKTTYQSFLWFYTSLRDHYNSGGKQSYSTLLYSIFFHHVEASCGPRARSPSANINFLQPQACSGLIFYSNTRGYVNNFKISIYLAIKTHTKQELCQKRSCFYQDQTLGLLFLAGAQSMIKDPEKVQLKVNIDIRVILVSKSYSCLFLLWHWMQRGWNNW